MITSVVTADYEPMVRVTVRDPSGQERNIEGHASEWSVRLVLAFSVRLARTQAYRSRVA